MAALMGRVLLLKICISILILPMERRVMRGYLMS